MTLPRLLATLIVLIALGPGTAFAAGPIAVTSVNVGAGGTDVVVPPVAVTDIDYDIE